MLSRVIRLPSAKLKHGVENTFLLHLVEDGSQESCRVSELVVLHVIRAASQGCIIKLDKPQSTTQY